MNAYHYGLLAIAFLSFLINLYKNGELKPESTYRYNAVTSFWSLVIVSILVILSAL